MTYQICHDCGGKSAFFELRSVSGSEIVVAEAFDLQFLVCSLLDVIHHRLRPRLIAATDEAARLHTGFADRFPHTNAGLGNDDCRRDFCGRNYRAVCEIS